MPSAFVRWSPAIRSAERLRGSLVRCGPGVRGIGWPETPEVRLQAIGEMLGSGRIAIGCTAAWVWGALRDPGIPLDSAMPNRQRPPHECRVGVRVRQLRIEAEHIVALGDRLVTSPLRTALDLLRAEEPLSPAVRVAARLLALTVPGGRAQLSELLRAGPRAGSLRAQARCAAL